MAYYSERNGLRTPIEKSYEITIDRYQRLFKVCRKYFQYIEWRYPQYSLFGCSLNMNNLIKDLKYEIPNLFDVSRDVLKVPRDDYYLKEKDDYCQSALLDFIEFIACYCRPIMPQHPITNATYECESLYNIDNYLYDNNVFRSFQKEINDVFQRTKLLYLLNDKKEVERIEEFSPLSPELETTLLSVKEPGLRELLNEAMKYHRSYRESDRKVAVDKIWKAFERLKTYYCEKLPGKPEDNKKDSAKKVIEAIVENVPQKYNETFNNEFTKEFKELTRIGNDYLIRHSETYKTDVSDLLHYDYFFNRCLSLIALAIPYLE